MFLSKAYLLIREKIHWPYTERIIQHTFLFLPHIPDYYRSRIVTWLSTWTQVKSFFISKLTSHQLWWTTFRVSCYLRNTAGTYWCYAIYYIRINISVAVHYKDHILTLYIYIYIYAGVVRLSGMVALSCSDMYIFGAGRFSITLGQQTMVSLLEVCLQMHI